MVFRTALFWPIFFALSCTTKFTPDQSKPTISNKNISFLTPKGPLAFQVSIADTEIARQKGLMLVKQLAPNAGMLFIFNESSVHTFWMKNTLIPLDMIFMDNNWIVVGIIENATPESEEPRSVPLPSRYVLEINGGLSKQLGINIGVKGIYDF